MGLYCDPSPISHSVACNKCLICIRQILICLGFNGDIKSHGGLRARSQQRFYLLRSVDLLVEVQPLHINSHRLPNANCLDSKSQTIRECREPESEKLINKPCLQNPILHNPALLNEKPCQQSFPLCILFATTSSQCFTCKYIIKPLPPVSQGHVNVFCSAALWCDRPQLLFQKILTIR